MCTKVYGSSADTIRLFVSIVDTFSLSSRIISVPIHLIYSWSSFHCQVISFLKITSLLIMTFFVMRLYNLYPIFLSPYLTKMHFSFLSSRLVILASGSLHKPYEKRLEDEYHLVCDHFIIFLERQLTDFWLGIDKRYITHDIIPAQYCLGNFFALSRHLAISRIIRLFISTTPFSCGV